MLPYINGNKKIIKRYKGTQLVYQAEDSSSGSIVTENTFSFKYLINNIVTNCNVYINGQLYSLTAADGESLGDNYYKYTITPTEVIQTIEFAGGNLYELYALPNGLISMNYMFSGCLNNLNYNLNGLNTSNVTDTAWMFSNLSLVGSQTADIVIDVTGWDISNVALYNNMFTNSNKIQKLILGNVSQSTYDWWSARLTEAGITPTIEYTIV